METPSTIKNSVTSSSKDSRQRKTGQALLDITNDSPIVGLTCGSLKTPLMSKGRSVTRSKVTKTPGSGEALLRGQVKNLLQMVEEETEIGKLQLPCRPFVGLYRALADSPFPLLAPANTPQIVSSGSENLGFELPSPIVKEPIFIAPEVNDVNDYVTRSLMLEFLEKEESECDSTVTNDVDDSSTWSTQVNAGTEGEDEYEDVGDVVVYKDEEYEYENAEYDAYDEGRDVGELCSGMSSLSVGAGTKLPLFTGKHIRFIDNSDDDEEAL